MNNTFFKKMTLAALVSACALVGNMANAEDNSSSLTLQMTGSITPPPCEMILNHTALELGSPLASDLKTSDQTPAEVNLRPLQVAFSGCSISNYEISVIGTADSKDHTILANNAATDAAGNVGIGVWSYKDGTQFKVNEAYPSTTGVYTLQFGLVKASATDAVTVGDISTTAQIKVTYL